MQTDPSWMLLGLFALVVLLLTGVAVWLSATEERAVAPAPARTRSGRDRS